MAHWIKTSGTTQVVSPANGIEFELEEIRRYIGGGYLEAVPYTKAEIMYIDSDGVPKQLPLNEKASEMISTVRGHPVPIYGDALVGTFAEMGDEEPSVKILPIDAQGRLHITVTRVDKPCEECRSTAYPNLEYNFPLVGSGVLCRKCLTAAVDEMNVALKGTQGGIIWEDPLDKERES